jgi:hypothetical protein
VLCSPALVCVVGVEAGRLSLTSMPHKFESCEKTSQNLTTRSGVLGALCHDVRAFIQ